MASFVRATFSLRGFLTGLLTVVVVLSLSLAANAQLGSSISGTVTDPTGAVIPGATVTIKNVATGATRTFTTGQSGRYDAPLLPPGEYEITVVASGFAQVVR
ncbi:MAG: carboxypeptidase-like regulatory domain-containing protein, partial [Terriglobia bacterium]